VSSSDFDLFLSSLENVTPINHDTVTPLSRIYSLTLSQQQKRNAAQYNSSIDETYLTSDLVELLAPPALLSFKKDGVQNAVFKNLRLAKYPLDATLDLRGQLLSNTRPLLFNFIHDCHQQNIRVVVIRHGIGIKNKTKPGILKNYVNKWLQELPAVLAFHSALKYQGGSGVTYVMLKKSDEKKHENRENHSKR
jgi:DNA-nicking Smr family endonuclease